MFYAWAAGFLDGEGCFVYRDTPRVTVSNTYPWCLLVLQSAFGGTVYYKKDRRKNPRPQYGWDLYGSKAIDCVTAVLPYLCEKKRQAEILVEARSYPARSRMRAKLKEELSTLKYIRYE